MNKKFAIVTYFDSTYFPGYQIMMESFIKFNSWFNEDVIIIDWGLTAEERQQCLNFYPKTTFINFDESKYNIIKEFEDEQYYAQNFKKFELLRVQGYDKIIILDADLIIVQDISKLFFEYNDEFYVDFNEDNHYDESVARPDTGLMVIDKRYLTEEYYQKCLDCMIPEFEKDTDNPTMVSNEYIFDIVFDEHLVDIEKEYCIADISYNSDITELMKDYRIIGTPEFKPWGKNELFMKFKDYYLESTTDIVKESLKAKQIIEGLGLWHVSWC